MQFIATYSWLNVMVLYLGEYVLSLHGGILTEEKGTIVTL